MVKPFIKWAGGKTQMLKDIKPVYPLELGKKINRYCEPFVGGGAVLFDVLSNFSLKEVFINDINAELINTYRIIKEDVVGLISHYGVFLTGAIGLRMTRHNIGILNGIDYNIFSK